MDVAQAQLSRATSYGCPTSLPANGSQCWANLRGTSTLISQLPVRTSSELQLTVRADGRNAPLGTRPRGGLCYPIRTQRPAIQLIISTDPSEVKLSLDYRHLYAWSIRRQRLSERLDLVDAAGGTS